MSRAAQSVGLSKSAFRHSTPPISTTHSIIDQSSSGEEEEEEKEEEEEESKSVSNTVQSRTLPRQRTSSSTRPKTEFQFAHPVASRRRLKLRLKLLLQLHEISRSSRPFPKYDVLPGDVPTRVCFKRPKPYGTARAFGARDLVVVTSDMYEQQSLATSDDRSVSSDESAHEQREVIATICQSGTDDSPRNCRFEVAFSSGICYEGIPLANGSYELVSKGGTAASRKVRWVARDKKPVKQSSNLSTAARSTSGASRFTFSVINPNTRQHPVIASMTRKGLTVFDQYSYPAAANSGDEQSPPGSPSTASSTDRGPVNTDEELRTLIVMTGIWVAFMEGWSSRSLVSGDAPCGARNESPLSPRGRSSMQLNIDGDAGSSPSVPGRPSRLNSFSRKRVINRRSTHSDFGQHALLAEQTELSPRRSKSLTLADRGDLQWSGVEAGAAKVADHDRVELDAGAEMAESGDAKSKSNSKGWRRFSSILRRKKR